MKQFINSYFIFSLIILIMGCSSNAPSRSISSVENHEKLISQMVSSKAYEEIKKTTQKILDLCPPADCIVIGLGRSPTPFMVQVKKSSKNSFNLPLSAFRYDYFRQELDQIEMNKLFSHFDQAVGGGHKLKDKKILLIDYAQSGSSLFSAYQYFREYLKNRGITGNLKSLAITSRFHDKHYIPDYEDMGFDEEPVKNIYEYAKHYNIDESEFDVLSLKENGGLANLLEDQFFDDFSEFKSISSNDWGKPLARNPNYKFLKNFIAKKQGQSKKLLKNCLSILNILN